MKTRSITERELLQAAQIGTGAKVAALLGMAAGLMALALMVARLVHS
jgi:hypothetical protein